MTNTQLIILIALGCFLVGVVVGSRLSRISRTQQVVLRDWRYLSLQLVLTLFIGVVIIWVAYNFVAQTEDEKSRVIVEAVKDFGVVVAGIAVVEIMWTIVGGSPVDKSLEHVTRTMSNFNHSVEQISRLFQSSARTGVIELGESQDTLAYTSAYFTSAIANARNVVQLCGASLNFIRAHDRTIDAMKKKSVENIPVKVLLPSPDSPNLLSMFKDQFGDELKTQIRALTNELRSGTSNIEVKWLRSKVLTMCILRVDADMLATQYLYSEQTAQCPRFRLEGTETALFEKYAREFESLFAIAEAAPPGQAGTP